MGYIASIVTDNISTKYKLFVDFERNYTILILIITLLGIFYLLGSIFIFDNLSDNIGNRLALTLRALLKS
jgi:hypothetical protein